MGVHRLSREEARRIAVSAQVLASPRPGDVLDVVRQLTLLQHDQTEAVAPSADLVLWSRLGSAYDPIWLDAAFEAGALIELQGMIRPAEDIALYRAEMAAWPGTVPLRPWQVYVREWVAANDACRRDILSRLDAEGPLAARDIPDTCAVPWQSSGWTNNRNVMKLLECMERRGDVAVTGRGRGRLWDLASRVYPDVPPLPLDDAAVVRARRWLHALGIARPSASEVWSNAAKLGGIGEPAVVEGTRGTWLVDPAYIDQPFTGRAALLSPLDRLVFDRKRALEIFGYDYQLEMYKPVAGRRWGYWALPILWGERLVGKLDAIADRKTGVLRVNALHQDIPFSAEMEMAVEQEITSLAKWLRLRL